MVPKLALYIKQYRDKAAAAAPGQQIMSSGHDPTTNPDGTNPNPNPNPNPEPDPNPNPNPYPNPNQAPTRSSKARGTCTS